MITQSYEALHGIIGPAQAPPCHRCGGKTSVQKIVTASEDQFLFFVVCAGTACTTRPEAEGRTGPAALSNGKDSQHLAEEDWLRDVRQKVEAKVPGYRLA